MNKCIQHYNKQILIVYETFVLNFKIKEKILIINLLLIVNNRNKIN